MTQIFNFEEARHRQAQGLLPWYANGTLDAAETAAVDKHLTECAECRADLERERALGQELARLPLDVDHGWERMRAQLEGKAQDIRRPAGLLRRRVPLTWALAAQAACLALAIGVTAMLAPGSNHTYRALGATTPPVNGNVVVIFKPDISEATLRGALREIDARVVDGPTTADAYVLHVDAARRTDALARLRASGEITLAEPIDAESRP